MTCAQPNSNRASSLAIAIATIALVLTTATWSEASNCEKLNHLKVDPKLFDYEIRAQQEYKKGETQRAKATWREAQRFATAHCLTSNLVDGDRLLRQGRLREAFTAYSMRLAPYDLLPGGYSDAGAVVPFEQGIVSGQAGNCSEAARSFRKAIKLANDIGFVEAYFMLGATLYALGEKSAAREQWLQTLLHQGPQCPRCQNRRTPGFQR